ncbi:MAG: dihydroneopterin aldolase [Crocinitomicaceae bacterium]
MKNHIEVNGIKCYAHHGCLEEEAKIGGHYVIDVALVTDFSEAMKTDDLTKTICYVDINTIVKEEMAIRSKLIEHVGGRIFNRIKNEINNIDHLRVKIVKICPPINGDVDNCSIIIED